MSLRRSAASCFNRPVWELTPPHSGRDPRPHLALKEPQTRPPPRAQLRSLVWTLLSTYGFSVPDVALPVGEPYNRSMRLTRRKHWRLRLAAPVVGLSLLAWSYFGDGGAWAFYAALALCIATTVPYIPDDIRRDRERKLRRGRAPHTT